MTAPLPGVQPPTERPALGAPVAQPHVFSVNGQPTSDFAAVQRHITLLETQASEARTAGRTAFIHGLAQRGAILATGVDDFIASVNRMDDETYDLFCKGYSTVPTMAAVGQHAAPAASTTGSAHSNGYSAQQVAANQEIEDAKQIVAAHRRNGMDPAALKNTGSYRKLVTAGIEQA